MSRNEQIVMSVALLVASSPAFASAPPVPAPIAGVGIGAVLLAGIGYRALKGRIK